MPNQKISAKQQEILQYIKGFLDQNNAIAVLQQIPYKDYENKMMILLFAAFRNI